MKTQLKYSFSNFIKLVETLILNIGLARVILDLLAFGKIQQFFVIVTLLVTLSTALPTTLNYFISKNIKIESRNSLYKRFFLSTILLSIISCLLLFLFEENLTVWFSNNFFNTYRLYFLTILFFKIVNTFFTNFYLFENKLNFFNLVTLIGVLLYLGGFVSFGYSKINIEYVLQFFVAYECLKFLVLFTPFSRSLMANHTTNRLLLKPDEFKFFIPTILLVLTGIFNMQIDKYMVSAMESPDVFAIYQVGAFNIPFIAVITTSFFTTITPDIVSFLEHNKTDYVIKLTYKTVKQTMVLLLPIIVFCFFFSNEIIMLLFGVKFEESGEVFRIYSLRFLLAVFPFSIFMGIIGLKNFASIHVIISAIINVIFNLILIPKFGVKGAVFATLIASYSTVVIPVYFINKRLSTKVFYYFPIKYMIKVLFVSILISLPIFLVTRYNPIIPYLYIIIPISLIYYVLTLVILEKSKILKLIYKIK